MVKDQMTQRLHIELQRLQTWLFAVPRLRAMVGANALAKRFLEHDIPAAFDKVLGSEVRALRRDVAHSEPTPEVMDDARTLMRRVELWSDKDTFLSQPLVQAVLQELGESEPEKLFERLLSEIRRRLVAPLHPGRLDTALTASK